MICVKMKELLIELKFFTIGNSIQLDVGESYNHMALETVPTNTWATTNNFDN